MNPLHRHQNVSFVADVQSMNHHPIEDPRYTHTNLGWTSHRKPLHSPDPWSFHSSIPSKKNKPLVHALSPYLAEDSLLFPLTAQNERPETTNIHPRVALFSLQLSPTPYNHLFCAMFRSVSIPSEIRPIIFRRYNTNIYRFRSTHFSWISWLTKDGRENLSIAA